MAGSGRPSSRRSRVPRSRSPSPPDPFPANSSRRPVPAGGHRTGMVLARAGTWKAGRRRRRIAIMSPIGVPTDAPGMSRSAAENLGPAPAAPADPAPGNRPVLSATAEEWRRWMGDRGHPAYRARQVLDWVIRRRAASFEPMSDLPRALRQQLDD